MNILKIKQREFFELADNLYPKCINDYHNLIKNKEKLDQNSFILEMREICSLMGLVCEYYLKGMAFEFLKIPDSAENENLKNIINNLSEEEKYKILIGDDTILRELSNQSKIKFKDLKELQQFSIKACGHHLTNILELFNDENLENNTIEISPELKKEMFDSIKNYYFNYFGFSEDYKEVNATNDEIIKSMNEGNIADSFVKGRYGHLDDYSLDSLKLVKLMHAIRDCIIKKHHSYTITNGNNGIDEATSIKMIFPDKDSKIFIFNSDLSINRVYSYRNYNDFYNDIYSSLAQSIYKSLNLSYVPHKDKDLHRDHQNDTKQENFGIDYITTPEYGIQEMIKVSEKHENIFFNFARSHCLLNGQGYIYIDKKTDQIISLFEDGVLTSYMECNDDVFRKTSAEFNLKLLAIVQEYEKNSHPIDDIAREILNFDEEKNRIIANEQDFIAMRLALIDKNFEFENKILNSIIHNKLYNLVSYFKESKDLRKERKKLLSDYKSLQSEKTEKRR